MLGLGASLANAGAIDSPKLTANAKSIDFDGTNDYIDLGTDLESWLEGAQKTFCCWIYNEGNTSEVRIFNVGYNDTGNATGFALGIDGDSLGGSMASNDNEPFVFLRTSAGAAIKLAFGDVMSTSTWYHLAIVQDGANDTAYCYQNGVLKATIASGEDAPYNFAVGEISQATDVSAKFGAAWFNTALYEFNGNIDEAAIWGRALKSSEIADIYNSKRMDFSQSSLSYSSNSLEGWWRMGDGDTYPYIADRRKTFVTGKSIDFDGSNDHINCGNNYSFLDDPDANEFTISAWINADVGADGSIFSKADNTNRMVQLYTNTNDALVARIGGTLISGATVVCDNTWKYVAIVVRNDGGTYKGQIYLNGSSDATEAAVSTTTATGMDFLIGARRQNDNTDLGYLFTGKITDVAIWDTALDAATLTSLYNSGEPNDLTLSASYTAGSGVDKSDDLYANWKMGGGTLDEYALVADQTNATLGSEELTNNGFESGVTLAASWTNMDGWVDETVLSSQNANATLDTSNARTGSNCMKMELLSGSSYLNYGLTNLAAGVYKFSLFFRAGASQTISSIRLGAATGLRGFTLGDSGSISSVSETYSEIVAYINNPSSQNVRFTISAGGTDTHFLFIDDISIKKVNGNPGVMTNMASGDILELAPNRLTGTMTNMASGDLETDVPT